MTLRVVNYKSVLDGYSDVKEFYSPNYSVLPEELDYRRTLYWNPAVTIDSNGISKIQLFNNSTCKNINISAETVTKGGRIGVNKIAMPVNCYYSFCNQLIIRD